MKKHLDDLLIFSGCAMILAATYLLSPIAALFVGGSMLIGGGVIIGLSQKGIK